MCFNLNVSIVSYVSGLLSAIVAFIYRQPILGSLLLCYSQMQLSEILIWYGIDNKNDKINRIGSIIGKYTLPLHNFAIGIGILIAYRDNLEDLKTWLPVLVGLIFYLIVIFLYYDNKVQKNNKNKLYRRR